MFEREQDGIGDRPWPTPERMTLADLAGRDGRLATAEAETDPGFPAPDSVSGNSVPSIR